MSYFRHDTAIVDDLVLKGIGRIYSSFSAHVTCNFCALHESLVSEPTEFRAARTRKR